MTKKEQQETAAYKRFAEHAALELGYGAEFIKRLRKLNTIPEISRAMELKRINKADAYYEWCVGR